MSNSAGVNWAGNVTYQSSGLAEPTSLDELRNLITSASTVRALGTRHCFNHLADTAGLQISTHRLPIPVEIDADTCRAWVPAAMRYGDLAVILEKQGWALHNYASLPHISVAGAIATGTHGSGDRNGTLASVVTGLEIVTAQGDVITLDEQDPRLSGAVVSLGALGVITRVQLTIEPSFVITQQVFDGVSRDQVRESFDAVFSAAYSVSCFTTWAPDGVAQLWVKGRETDVMPSSTWLGGHLADGKRHPVPGCDPIHCTEQGDFGASFDRLPHFKLEFTPSSGEEFQTEYLVPRTEAPRLLSELEVLAPRIHPLLMVSEWRTMRADEQWLSPAQGRDTVGIHFTWKPEPAVFDVLPAIDELLGGSGGRPHWGKLFDADVEALRSRYPRFNDFAELVTQWDPTGKFANDMTNTLLNGAGRIGQ